MKKQYFGLDVLRGIGIFSVIVLHTAFYYFDGIYDLDLNNPPLIITLIGFILMFAGLFAMISGFVHTWQMHRKINEKGMNHKQILHYSLKAGLYILIIAYLYFLFTGPGIIDFANRRMDQSVLVELIKTGYFTLPSLDRIFYVDSLVMIGLNILLLGLISYIGFKWAAAVKHKAIFYYVLALLVLVISVVRIPLYSVYLDARDGGNYFLVGLLNFFVNKNNPILPFLSFGLFGAWLSVLYMVPEKLKHNWMIILNAIFYVVVGLVIYLTAEQTMLARQIDYTWYGIMVFQIGLFQLLIMLFIKWFSRVEKSSDLNIFTKFFYRFGIAGLTVFFFEQLFSSALKKVLQVFNRDLFLDIPISILLGIGLAILYGFILMLWQKFDYKYGLEYGYTRFVKSIATSEKASKLEE